MGRHYLDHASTSPARPEVVEAMLPWLAGEHAADPGRVHTEGRMARAAVEHAREQVAALVGARPREIVFTSGATEAVNAVAFGAGGPVACARIEHSAVRDSAARHGVVKLAVDGLGRIDLASVDAALDAGARIVHCQWGNHEVGTVQPVADVMQRCRARGDGVLVHVDAAQAVGRVAVDFRQLDIDFMSVSAHKFGGPKGIGALVVRRGLRLDPFIVGGDQERARRAGLENVPAIVGFGAAADLPPVDTRPLLDRLADAALALPGVTRFGDPSPAGSLSHILCLGVDGVEAEAVLLGLDQAGIAAHSGSACSSESLEPSPVLQAMGVQAKRSLRLSLGWSSTEEDVDAFADAFPRVVERLRRLAAG